MFPKAIILLIFLYIVFTSFSAIQTDQPGADKIKGITVVAPPSPFLKDPMPEIFNIKANWIALVPYAYSPLGKPDIHYCTNHWQWWGERPEGIIESIELAKKSNLKIMLKPQIYIHKGWVGNMDYGKEEEWLAWETNYSAYLLYFAKLAEEKNIEMLCIGTEFDIASEKRIKFWRNLIQEIRKTYNGKITYSCNWNNTHKITFWDALDFIGVSAYFPLLEDEIPEKEKLKNAWIPYLQDLEQLSLTWNKPILFTEYGYLTVDGCAGKSWELEKMISTLDINQEAQAKAFEGLYSSVWNKKWWAGGFIWKWFPNGEGHEGYPEKDYTPQGKHALKVIHHWFSN